MRPTERWLAYRAARLGFNFARSAEFRSVMLLRWRNPKNLFQPFSETNLDRYPDIFRFAREQVGDDSSHRILSFGCATGEEVFSLRRYFPLAHIRGLDINTRISGGRDRALQCDFLHGRVSPRRPWTIGQELPVRPLDSLRCLRAHIGRPC